MFLCAKHKQNPKSLYDLLYAGIMDERKGANMRHTLLSLARYLAKMTELIKAAILDGEYGRAITYLDRTRDTCYKVIIQETVEDPEINFNRLLGNHRKDK